MTKTELAKSLHSAIHSAISQWAGNFQTIEGKPLSGQEFLWALPSAVAIELLMLSHTAKVPITKVMQSVKEIVARPDVISYVLKSLKHQ